MRFQPHTPCRTLLLVAALCGCAGSVQALDAFIVGPRALGMGGTGVASTNDHTAQFYNPAMFGFFGEASDYDNQGLADKHWGLGLDANVGARVHGNLLELAQTLAQTDIKGLANNGIQNQQDLHAVVNAARALGDIGDPGNAVSTDASVGLSMRLGHGAIGARIYGQAASLVGNTDLKNVALAVAGLALANAINNTGSANDGQVLLFTTAQRDSLYTALGGVGSYAANTGSAAAQAVQRLDNELRSQGFTASQVATVATVIQNAATNAGAGIDQNTTVVRLQAFALAEVPLSYGWRLGDHWSVGGSLKLMMGRVYGTSVAVFKDDAVTRFEQSVDNSNTTLGWGVDLAAAGRWNWFQAGVVARNINSPKFTGFENPDGSRIADVTVDPQVAVGVALIPRRWVTLALDADVLPAESSFNGYHTQRVGAGLELNPWDILALRGGVYQNIAESDIGPVMTLGAGINLWAVRIDLAAAASTHLVDIQGYRIPDEARVSLGVMADW